MNTTKTILTSLFLVLLLSSSSYGQQWFVKTWKFPQSGEQQPDYDPQGSYLSPDESGIILYGTVNYSEGELDNTQGKAEVLINKNDIDGNSIWTLTLGTSADEYVSRVIEDEDGNLVVAVNQYQDGVYTAHLIKVDVSFSGSYSFSVAQQIARTEFKIKDLIETFTPLTENARGYAFTGYDYAEEKAAIGSVDQNLDYTGSNFYIKHFEGMAGADKTELLSLIQPAVTVEEPGGIVNTSYLNTLVVCGSTEIGFYGGRVAYLAKVNLYNGNVYDDMTTAYGYSSCDYIYYVGNGPFPRAFSEVIKADDGGYVCLTQTVEPEVEGGGVDEYAAHIMYITSDLNNISWSSRARVKGIDNNNTFCQLDLVETELFYTVVMSNPANSFTPYYMVVNFEKDGDYNGHVYLSDPVGNAGISSSVEDYDELHVGQQFIKDFALTCGDQLHFPAALQGAAPASFNASYFTHQGVTHVKKSVGDLEAMCLVNTFDIEEQFCDEITIFEEYPMDGEIWGNTTNDIDFEETEFFIEQEHTASFYEHENCKSECETYACGPIVTTIYECASDLSTKGSILLIPHASDVKDVLWSNGTLDNDGTDGFGLSVFFPGLYEAKVRTIGGCVRYYEYNVVTHPETNLAATVTPLDCHDDDDAEICFTADANIVSATIEYTYNGAAYAPTTVSVGATAFCFSDLIASIHGAVNGLEAGYYEITVTDDNGCTDNYSVTIVNPDELLVSAYFDCGSAGLGDETLVVDIQGGSLPYFFSIYKSAGVGTLQAVPSTQWPNAWINNPSTELPIIAENSATNPNNIERQHSSGALWDYQVNVFDDNGCQVSISGLNVPICPFPNDALSIAENADGSIALSVYPNPATDFTTVRAQAAGEFNLYSTTGKVVMTGQLMEGDTQLDLSSLSSGLYLLKSNGMQVNVVVE